MKNFRYETPVLTQIDGTNIYETNDGEIFFPGHSLLSWYELGEELPEKISLGISSKPTKQAVLVKIREYCDIYCSGDTFQMKEDTNKRLPYSRVYIGFRRFLEKLEPFKSMGHSETLLVYVTLYIHSK
jgi:hypothetical protein